MTLDNALGNGSFLGVTQDESVPIGQNEHHVRGTHMNERVTPTTVVIAMMFQNTCPIAFQSPKDYDTNALKWNINRLHRLNFAKNQGGGGRS
ncbi:MAG: hypothetical protein K2G52_01100 [Muribaculaceae bacterium]|nr:hypothetical protein [Muribaculaceae bacterium]